MEGRQPPDSVRQGGLAAAKHGFHLSPGRLKRANHSRDDRRPNGGSCGEWSFHGRFRFSQHESLSGKCDESIIASDSGNA